MAGPDRSRFRPEDTRSSYDAVAERYAAEIAGELAKKPFDRAFLDRFAESVVDRGHVVDLGTGPGHVAAYLNERRVDVSGLDLSPKMVDVARERNPAIEFVVGSMLDLPFDDRSLVGLVAFYSIIHFDDEQLVRAFSEMYRVLRPGGELALAFHNGDEVVHRDEWWDLPVNVDFRFLDDERIAGMLERAGFQSPNRQLRDPYEPSVEYQSVRVYMTAVKLPPFELGYVRTELRRKLVDAVLSGKKTGTAGLATDHVPHTNEPLPVPGDRWLMVGYHDEPQAVVETTELRVVHASDVDLQFAIDEGEGFESVAEWRAAHERFWSDKQINDETLVVCEHFRVVERISPA